jgi:hypothetical protein
MSRSSPKRPSPLKGESVLAGEAILAGGTVEGLAHLSYQDRCIIWIPACAGMTQKASLPPVEYLFVHWTE